MPDCSWMDANTVALYKRKLFIIEPFLILVLTMLLCFSLHTDAKSDIENYQGQQLLEKPQSYLLGTSNARLQFSMFSNLSYFCMCNFVWGNKIHFALFPQTKSYMYAQKCYQLAERDIKKNSRGIIFKSSTVHVHGYRLGAYYIHRDDIILLVQYSGVQYLEFTKFSITCSCTAVPNVIRGLGCLVATHIVQA
jgi:hypothetical protein